VGSLYLVGTLRLMVMAPSGAGIDPATGGGGGWKEPSIGGACGGDQHQGSQSYNLKCSRKILDGGF